MTESKGAKPEIPHKPSPRNVASRPLSTDYRADPANPYPLIATAPKSSKPAREVKEPRAPKSPKLAPFPAPKSARQSVRDAFAMVSGLARRSSAEDAAPPAGESTAAESAESAPSAQSAQSAATRSPAGDRSDSAAARRASVARSTVPLDSLPFAAAGPAVHSAGSTHSRDHKALRIAHLYPSLLNVAGDGGNLIAIQRRAQWRGIPVEIVAVEKGETPDFRKFDIILFHGGQDVEMAVAAEDFALKAPSLRQAADDGVVIFAVCAGLQLLGHRYVSNTGEEMLGAGILDLETRGGPQRFMQHAACEVTIDGVTETIVGFENHSGLTRLGPGCEPFGRVIAGAGNNGRDGIEGARYRNVFATYLHGPCLPKNPWLTDQLIRLAVGRAEGVRPSRVVLAPLNDELEDRAHDMALAKAMANRGHRTALEPARLVRGQKG
jgi:CobQ-like glutamine amidotransferase family enzyme